MKSEDQHEELNRYRYERKGGMVLGLTGVLIALIVLTIVLAGVFLVRSSITVEPLGKILAFIGLCVLPTLCIGAGMSFHMQRSQQTAYCISCHSMESHGESLHVLDTSYIPAQHFQNHFVPPDKACYTCHTDYTMYGPLKDKLKGLRYLYMEYVSTPPKVIHLDGKYSNLQCLHCHAGAREFEENLPHMPPLASLESGQISCISSGCHATIHNVSEVGHLKMWTGGPGPTAATSAASGSPSPAPGNAKPAAAAAPSKAPAGSSPGNAIAVRGKTIFDSDGCSGCHGESGSGGSGPALTHISSQYPPAKLTAVLKAPTAKMTAAGMVALTLSAADMKALVSYVTGLGGTSAASAATPKAARSASPKSVKAQPGATPGAPKAASAATSPASGSPSPAPANAKAVAAAAPSKAPAGSSPGGATAVAAGKAIFDSHGCSGCHGESGSGGSGPALTHISSQYPPAKLTAVLKAPTAKMTAAGMVALTLNAADMKALVSYVSSLGGTSAASAATTPASGAPAPAPATTEPTARAAPSNEGSNGEVIFKTHGCAECHGANGVGGKAPRLAGQNSSYMVNQLLRFGAGDRAHAIKMTSAAKELDKEQIRAVAAFLASQ